MNFEIQNLIKTFESDNKGKKRFNDFLQYCFISIKNPKKNSKSKKIINKYDILRQDLIKYLIANEKEITTELSK
tara:strand:+ start:292 stop:513 length:222 start_codon:yes stop_codon:yes gene_type:complete